MVLYYLAIQFCKWGLNNNIILISQYLTKTIPISIM